MTITVPLLDDETRYSASLRAVETAIINSKKCIVLSGAGISTSSGIPDFRSLHGLYNADASPLSSKSSNTSAPKLKGKDLFDASVLRTAESSSAFLSFAANLHDEARKAKPTKTHEFLATLAKKGKLLRNYSQNIDCLEIRAGLNLVENISSQVKGKKKAKKHEGNLVQLHGSLEKIICTVCCQPRQWSDDLQAEFLQASAPECSLCLEQQESRTKAGKRKTGRVGSTRPGIVLYGESNPDEFLIGECVEQDVKAKPDLIIVMGTSLKVHGFKKLVKDFVRNMKDKKATAIAVVVDMGDVATSEWQSVFDYHIKGDCDQWSTSVLSGWKSRKPEDFMQQTILSSTKITKQSLSASTAKKPAPPSSTPSRKRQAPTDQSEDIMSSASSKRYKMGDLGLPSSPGKVARAPISRALSSDSIDEVISIDSSSDVE